MTAAFRIFSWRIILNRSYFDGRYFASTMQCLKACWALPKLYTMRSVSSHEGTCRCNASLGHVPAPFSSVCRCCDFVSATCPRYTTLLHVDSVGTTHFEKTKKYSKSAMLNDVTSPHQRYLHLYPVLLCGSLSPGLGLPNLRISLAEIETDGGSDFPI